MIAGNTYGYNFNNSDGSGYESGSSLDGVCAGGNYGNDRTYTVAEDAAGTEILLDTVCWESCDACPAVVEGCTDDTAENYNSDATVDDGSCEYEQLEAANLFISEASEGSSNNKYIEIYNASADLVDLSAYAYPTVGNAPSTPGEYEFWNTFEDGAVVVSGDVYVICHGSSDDAILAECDETYSYMSNGDDGLCLVFGSEGNFQLLDCVGDWNGDPGSGWDVAGVSAATKDHTIVRKESVTTGNADWVMSAGTSADDSEWVVFPQNTWTYLGSHPHTDLVVEEPPSSCAEIGCGASYDPAYACQCNESCVDYENCCDDYADLCTEPDVLGCMDVNATNYNPDATMQDYNEFGTSLCTYESCETIPTEMGCLWEDGTSSMWWDGWWNCEGGQVCGLAEVVFEVNLPEGVSGTPHVNGTYNGWCGSCYNSMSDEDGDGTWSHVQYFSAGEYHDYKFTINGWEAQEDLTGLDCAAEADGYWNRNFTAGEANTSQTLTYCYGSCDSTCEVASSCGDGTCGEDEDCSSCAADCGACPESTVTFDLDGLDNCGFVSVTGTFDNWSGWGANTDTGMAATMPNGDYEFIILCVEDTSGEWYNDIWGSSIAYNAPLEGACWNGNYEYPNYTLSVSGDMTVSYCAGTCDAECTAADPCGDGVCADDEDCSTCAADCGECQDYLVTFGFDGLDDCGQVNISGTWDNWSGWGVNPADHPDYTISLPAGDYEFKYICVDTSVDGWWDDVWGNSVAYGAPLEGECWNGSYEYANYAFSVSSDMTISYCAGTCDAECAAVDPCGDGVCADDEDCSTCAADCGECQEYSVTFGFDGLDDCGQVNVTGTFDNWSGWGVNPADHPDYTISLADGAYEFIYLCVDTSNDGWWNDVWGNSTTVNPPVDGACSNGDDTYTNYVFTVAGADMTVSYCADTCDAECAAACVPGDADGDGQVVVLDIVQIVAGILAGNYYNECADVDGDGQVAVLDIVQIVASILSGDARSADATSATMNIANDSVSISGNGFIGAIQMTLSHGAGFSIDLTDDAMVADYRTSGNTTTLIVVAPNSDEIFTAYGDLVEETLVASGNGYVPLSTPASFTLSAAYPNPFNPSTSLDMTMPSEGYVSIQAYNLVGQVVGTIAEGNMSAGTHSFAWDASDLSSGVYLIKAEYAGSVATQKVMMLK